MNTIKQIHPCKKQAELMQSLGFERYDEYKEFYIYWRLRISGHGSSSIYIFYEFHPNITPDQSVLGSYYPNIENLVNQAYRMGRESIQIRIRKTLGL